MATQYKLWRASVIGVGLLVASCVAAPENGGYAQQQGYPRQGYPPPPPPPQSYPTQYPAQPVAGGNGQPYAGQTFGADNRYCNRGALSNVFSGSTNSIVGSLAGGAAGGLAGNQFGKGSGKAVMTIAGILGGALAGGAIGRAMEPVDQACVGRALESTPTGQSVAWQNPDDKSSYWVTPTNTYQGAGGQHCRRYVSTAIIAGRTERTEGTACRQPDGTWAQQ